MRKVQDLGCDRPEDQAAQRAAPVRAHDDHVAVMQFRVLGDHLAWIAELHVHGGIDAGSRENVFRRGEEFLPCLAQLSVTPDSFPAVKRAVESAESG